ncbi:hypothetical protein NDU88_003441 [Pleurodeles waltl]|uniref:Uncharacterized protein n=1 Tax=Pleurodeles waltl TaxID=8319 RepID=A0AAV7RCV7_PLEWA|nr:hypothetical protein NDU88_003441 [Pleurodeles waltl]
MLLIIETAQGVVLIERQEIEELEKALKESMALDNAKKCLEEINQDVDGYREYLINKKSVKLRKYINRFSYELVYPYLQKDFYQNKKDQGGDVNPGRRISPEIELKRKGDRRKGYATKEPTTTGIHQNKESTVLEVDQAPIINLSARTLTNIEVEVLEKGLSFAPTANINRVGKEVELFEIAVDKEIQRIVRNPFKRKNNLSRDHYNALCALQEDVSITIKPADKAGGVVVFDTRDYERRSADLLSVQDHYQKVSMN